ncbi:MAG: arginine--tRNA ligase [Deltaproteobacteria bacterium]|nr:arginine--tRNA ligase [Deltaproteobacteria bacterium]
MNAPALDPATLTVDGILTHLKARVAEALRQLGAEAPVELAPPPQPELGDFGFPCFALAKSLRKAPPLIAKELAALIAPDALVAEVGTAGAYVNLRLRREALVQVVLREVLSEQARYGAGQARPPQQVMVEYSSPNTNKPLHLGHLRNNLLGASVAALLRHVGHAVTRINLVNDRGVHICKSMLAYQKWGGGADPERAGVKGDHFVGDSYVAFEKRFAEEYAAWQQSDLARSKVAAWLESPDGLVATKAKAKDPSAPDPEKAYFDGFKDEYFNALSPLGAEVRQMLVRWEQGDGEVTALWEKMNAWVLSGFEATYRRMGVAFEETQYESQTYKLGKELVHEGLAKGVLARRPDGAVVCDLAQVGLQGEKVLLRGDGTSVYMTQDLGTALERFDSRHLDRLIYVVGDEQNYHFEVLFKVLGLLRPGMTERCHHLSYGMIRLPEGRMKSREGTVVDADDLMDEVHALARQETLAKAEEGKAHVADLSDAELEHRAEQIGLAALKYFLLKFSPRKSFEYDPKESIDFLGQTGPYCLFNYARTRSLMRKAGGEPVYRAEAAARVGSDQELAVVRLLYAFPEVVARAAQTYDPSRVAEYLFELCKGFAFIFTDKTNHPIVTCEDAELREGRLMLAAAVSHTLRTGLGLLGIEALEEM